MPQTAYFTEDSLKFLKQLKTHNEKTWFEANKARYEEGVRDPALRMVSDLAPRLAKVSSHFVADPRPNGGSLSRIYRDTRFSADKSPYKTALFFHFHHDAGDDEAMPAFYLRIEPGSSVAGGGIWHPATPKLEQIRKTLVDESSAWAKAKSKSGVGAGCAMGGEMLKKVPRGYDPEHVHAEDLRRKDFGVSGPLEDRVLTSPKLLDELTARFREASPVISFLCDAIGLPF
jgi:uncharacterized protein (TIGR02453 family)